MHRFDDAYRLTDEYWGAWLGGANLDTYADPANTPTTFSFQREYSLDTRGNRTQVEDFDSSTNSLRSVSYSPDADTNVYDSVDGQTFSFDAIEQTTHDPSTGLYHAYDYKGQLTESDDDSDFSSPERRYFYDTHGRMRIEERWINTTHTLIDSTFSTFFPDDAVCACDVDQLTAAGQMRFGGGSPTNPAMVTLQTLDEKSPVTGSSQAVNEYSAVPALPGGGGGGGKGGVILEAIDKDANGTIDEWHYHHEDQLGTLRGMTDANGIRIAEIDTSKYGEVYQKDILFDGRPSRVDTVISPEEGVTRITLLNGYTYPETVEGAVLRAAPEAGGTPIAASSNAHATRPGPTAGTLFHIAKLELHKLFLMLYLVVAEKDGANAKQLQRQAVVVAVRPRGSQRVEIDGDGAEEKRKNTALLQRERRDVPRNGPDLKLVVTPFA